jgi:hypothetical protein
MLKADQAEVSWDENKKNWVVRIQVGEEVMRRICKESKHDLDDSALRELAVKTAADDGYQIAPEAVTVKR